MTTLMAKLKSGKPVRIVCFGDSVTGLYYHTGGRRTYTDMLGIALRRAMPVADVTTINAGISGNTAIAGLKRIERDVLSKKPDLVTVMFGLNDMVRRPLDQYQKNLEEIVALCRAAGSDVLLCTPNAVTDTSRRPTAKLVQYCEIIRDIANKTQVPLCDTYAAFDELRKTDRTRWRLTMSDPIHPNMGGHRFIAEQITKSVTGKSVSLAGTPPPEDPLRHLRQLVMTDKPVRVLAMPPYDQLLNSILPKGRTQVTPWSVEKQSLPQIELHARKTVRKMKPDLVLLAVPRTASFASNEEFIKSHTWIQNWSLSFGREVWSCVIVHPSVTDGHGDQQLDTTIRQLVSAHDLHLIDRSAKDKRPATEIVREWFQRHLSSEAAVR
jgi:lysophospholipase L1-like esterase